MWWSFFPVPDIGAAVPEPEIKMLVLLAFGISPVILWGVSEGMKYPSYAYAVVGVFGRRREREVERDWLRERMPGVAGGERAAM
jgi:hypothetical protein